MKEHKEAKTDEQNGTLVTFIPDDTVFKNFHFLQNTWRTRSGTIVT